jgi:hypothetical protein
MNPTKSQSAAEAGSDERLRALLEVLTSDQRKPVEDLHGSDDKLNEQLQDFRGVSLQPKLGEDSDNLIPRVSRLDGETSDRVMNWRRGLFRLWAAASLIWMLLIIAIAIGAKLHPEFRVSDRIKSVPLRETVDRERERQEAYKSGPLLENLKTGYEEAVRGGLVSPSNEAFVVHNETGDILYRPAGADNNWEPIVIAVVKNKREMFGLVSKKWKQISEQGRPGITRRIEDALRDTNNEWVLWIVLGFRYREPSDDRDVGVAPAAPVQAGRPVPAQAAQIAQVEKLIGQLSQLPKVEKSNGDRAKTTDLTV